MFCTIGWLTIFDWKDIQNIGNCCVLSEFNLLSNFHSENKSFWVLLVGRLVAWHVSNSNKMFLKFPPVYFCQFVYSKKVTYLSHIKECLAQLDNLYLSFFQKLVNLCTLSIFHPTEYLIKLSSIYRYELVKKWSACLQSYNDYFLTLGQFVSKNGKYRSIFDMPQKC